MTESEVVELVRQAKVDWNRPAKVYEQLIGVGYVRGGAVYEGTLGSAVKRFMELQGQIGKMYTVGVDVGAISGLESGLLFPRMVLELAAREDCPG